MKLRYMGMGVLQRVGNHQRKFGSADSYLHVRVKDGGGKTDLLLTDGELKEAESRASKNREDIPHPIGLWQRLIAALID